MNKESNLERMLQEDYGDPESIGTTTVQHVDAPDLRKLAGNATEGPWIRDYTDVCVDIEHKTLVAETRCASDAAYIAAANPAAIIELLDELDEMRAAIIEAMHISLFTNAGENMNEILAKYFRENSND